jgi:hypothetical protein
MDIAVLAGALADGIFMACELPMLIKAGRIKGPFFYSILNIVLSKCGKCPLRALRVHLLPGFIRGKLWGRSHL